MVSKISNALNTKKLIPVGGLMLFVIDCSEYNGVEGIRRGVDLGRPRRHRCLRPCCHGL